MSQRKSLAPLLLQGKFRISISARVPDNLARRFCHFDFSFALYMGRIILNMPGLFMSVICYSIAFHPKANKACR